MKIDAIARRVLPAAALCLLAAGTAYAQTTPAAPAVPTPDKGDTSWMLISSVLVLMMSVPGLALFYGGLVRTKNMASMLSQCFAITSMVLVLWAVYGYSLTFTAGGGLNSFIGGFSKAFLAGITPSSTVETFSKGVVIPEFVYIFFQGTFAAITPALIVGAFAERIKFSALLLFIALWATFIYFPMAHMVWFWGGPSAYADPAGLIFSFGALDFAGGTVVHINAGMAGLVGCILIGKRVGYGKEPLPPHSLTLSMVGAALLWVGWFGFNAGSNLESNGGAALAAINTLLATAAASVSWMFVEWAIKGKPSLLGIISGAVAGLVAVTPACGFAGPMGSIILGLIVSPICVFFVTTVKNALGYDDSLDVFGVHGVGGIVGAIATGILVSPSLGGAGIVDYSTPDFAATFPGYATQVIAQLKAVGVTILWSGIGSAILYKIVDLVIGLRVPVEAEREGLDITAHGEAAYHS
ncbi:ammonium transporter [Segnochrobactrum spirostomi]|uniref:Ammonium transporter n=1 Tax=Segnochrobactrum spirostomi TaxID=2608987 RepID=A0A6A7Y230_9HYPH|nr:ammonium transporter [Segnochrobactrum spirostomi]MQT12437.1 ammonium transporter [Segnochrobactrum spirostomi]